MTNAEKNLICRQFDLGSVISCRQLDGTRNLNFVLPQVAAPFFVRKLYCGYCDTERIAFDHEALAYLKGREVAVVAPRATTAGKTWVQEEGKTWEFSPALTGRQFREGD